MVSRPTAQPVRSQPFQQGASSAPLAKQAHANEKSSSRHHQSPHAALEVAQAKRGTSHPAVYTNDSSNRSAFSLPADKSLLARHRWAYTRVSAP